MSEFLSLRNLVKEYAEGENRLRVLQGVSLDIEDGEFAVIAGASGAGKSTLLHLMGLLDRPTSGQVFFEGKNLSRLPGAEQSRLRNELFGAFFQFFHLLPDFNSIENVMMSALVGSGMFRWHAKKRKARERAKTLLAQVGLGDRMTHRPNQLSGGERQRVAICRALMNKPRLLLLDEPTGNLDSKTGGKIHDLIQDLNQSHGQTIVMVTHDESATRYASRVIRIRDGRLTS